MLGPGRPVVVSRTWQVMNGREDMIGFGLIWDVVEGSLGGKNGGSL